MMEPLLTHEENLEILIIKDIAGEIIAKRLRELSLSEDEIIVMQLLVDMIDLSCGEGSLREVEDMIAAHFGASRAKQVKNDLVGLFTELFEALSRKPVALVRVAMLRKLADAIAAAPPGAVRVVDGNLLVRRRKL